jgi:tetrahydromethanopterin S-methyltransferase subunit F
MLKMKNSIMDQIKSTVDGITYKLDLIAEIEDKGEEIEH